MAFLLADLEEKISQTEYAHLVSYYKFRENPNLQVVVDYLTGQSTSLQGIDPTQQNFLFFVFVDLLQSPEAPTGNDKLLLDVLYNPGILPAVQHHLLNWLIGYLARKDDEKVLQAVIALFQKVGFFTVNIFEQLLAGLQNYSQSYNIFDKSHSAVKSYLIEHLPSHIINHQYYSHHVFSQWNYFYFHLMEEAQPRLVNEYLFTGLHLLHQQITETILQHKEGKYVPEVLQWLRKPSSEAEWLAKFHTAIVLSQIYKQTYKEQVTEAAKVYLQHFAYFYVKDRWERSYYANQVDETGLGSSSFRAIAVHLLLPEEKEFVVEVVGSWFAKKIFVSFDVIRMLQYHLGEEALPYLQAALQSANTAGGTDYYKNLLQLLAGKFSPDAYLPVAWQLVTTKTRQVRDAVARIISENDKEAEVKAIKLLNHKNAEARQMGALILTSFSSSAAIDAVKQLLERETNDNARDIFLQIVKDNLPVKGDEAWIRQMVASAQSRGKLSKPAEPWLDESTLPPLYAASGEVLKQEDVRFILYRMSRVKGMRSETEANYLLEQLDKERCLPFVQTIMDRYIENGSKPEQKYLLALVALIATEEMVDRIRMLINRWIDEGRLKMAEYGVGALALQGSDKALRWGEWYSRKYKAKKANIGAAALQALEDAAEELGITIHELGDRVVPDFGFEGLYKTFTINEEEYRAFIDSRFKLCFFNEDNKQLKTLPAAADVELKEEFKQIGKEVRDVVRSQSGRMEFYLLLQRKWTSDNWKQFFLSNPVMFIYATKILWGIYNEEGELLNCFLSLEDTTLIDVNDDEITIDENLLIGIVHPLHLSAEKSESWKRKFFDLSIEPVFPQLQRGVFQPKPEEAQNKIINAFVGNETATGAIKSTLERFGWRKGEAADAGFINSFFLEDNVKRVTAILEVEGVFVGGFGNDHEPKLGKLYFIDQTKQKTKWFQTPENENDERLLTVRGLSPVFYSEVIYNIKSIKLKENDTM